jgi:drug/metabolite transporter (DMT)-like permease
MIRSPLAKAVPLVVILTLVWGTNWPLFPIVAREVSVWTFRAVSLTGAAIVLLALARARGESLAIPRSHWPAVVAAALAYLVVWNVASTYAAILIPSGQAAILGFTMPLWAALIAWAWLGQRPGPRLLVALALGGLGVGLLLVEGMSAYAKAPLGFALGLLAGLGWGLGTVLLKRAAVPVTPLVLTGWQLLIAAVPITVGALVFHDGPWQWPSTGIVLLIGYITLVPMAVGNAAWFAIVGLLPPNMAGLASIMVPMVAMLAGAWLHQEPLGASQWAAMACCAAGLALALTSGKRP